MGIVMLRLQVERQEEFVEGRTLEYRMVLTLTDTDPGADPAWFIVYREDTGGEHFEGVAQPIEREELPSTPQTGYYRSDRVDLYWPTDEIADEGLQAIVADIEQVIGLIARKTSTVEITGDTV